MGYVAGGAHHATVIVLDLIIIKKGFSGRYTLY